MDSQVDLPHRTEVVIVGAGPTGLALAATLAAAGVEFVILDRQAEGANTSRAAVVHARTLEVLDELGRRCCWVTLDAAGPRCLTLACKPADLEQPSDLAERLPKVLIHRNVPGERVHALFTALDHCWAVAAPFANFGPRARWTTGRRGRCWGRPSGSIASRSRYRSGTGSHRTS